MLDSTYCSGCPLESIAAPVEIHGNTQARFMIVTDTPSRFNAAKGRVLPESSTRMFSKHMEAVGFSRPDFLFVPQIRCPHEADQYETKQKREIQKHCREHLLDDIHEFRPELIVPLGAESARQVCGHAVKITKVRGVAEYNEEHSAMVMAMLNPGQVVMYPQHESIFAADCRTMARVVGSDYDVLAAGNELLGEYEFIDDLQFLVDMEPKLLFFDTETTGLEYFKEGPDNVREYDPVRHGKEFNPPAAILTMQFCVRPGKAYMLVWDHPEAPISLRKKRKVLQQLTQLLCNPKTRVLGQNAKYDNTYLYAQTGIRYKIGGDTLMIASLLDENMISKNQDVLVKHYVPQCGGYADSFNATVDKSRMWEVPLSKLLDYGCGDVDTGMLLYKAMIKVLVEDERLLAHYLYVSLPGLNVFAGVETRGILIDENALEAFETVIAESVAAQYTSLMAQVPKAIKRKHIDKGLKFSRGDFVRDILFTHREGFRLRPKVYTETTRNLSADKRVPSTSTKEHLPYFYDECPFAMELAQYVKDERLLGTNIRSFKKKYIHEGLVRPTYSLHTAVTGRSACLTGDTPIYVLDNRGVVAMRDMREGDWVWSFGDDGLPVPARVSWAGKTREKAALLEVTYQTQGNRSVKSIRCTDNHPFLLRDGTYVSADRLEVGHRVMALERKVNAGGYRRCHATGGLEFLEHIRVAEISSGDSATGMHVHHGNECKTDNVPINLHILTPAEHIQEHPWTAERIEKRERTREWSIFRRGWRAKKQPKQVFFSKTWAETVLHEAAGKPTVFRDKYGYDYTTAMRALRDCGVDWRGIRGQYTGSGVRITPALLEQARACSKIHDAVKLLGTSFYKAKELLAADNNHMILSVRRIRVREDVYDLTVPGTHNFIANGVCVHNSENPNGQNFPKRGPNAKAYRRIFVAPPGHYVLEADLSQAELRIAANMANDRRMLSIYQNRGDIHSATAAIVVGVPLAEFLTWGHDKRKLVEVANSIPGSGNFLRKLNPGARVEATVRDYYKQKRFEAKAVNFGFIYGMGWRKFVGYAKTQYGVEFTDEEAQQVRTVFFETYSGLPAWHEAMRQFALREGYVRSYSGRVRHLPMIHSEDEGVAAEAGRQAINSPVQEFASSLGIMACGRIHEEISPEYSAPIAFVHDAIYTYVPMQYLEWGAKMLKHYMESNDIEGLFGIRMKCPIIADVSFGRNFGDTSEMEGLELDKPYDFGQFWDEEKQSGILVPQQRTPPNNGRATNPPYTMPAVEPKGLAHIHRTR